MKKKVMAILLVTLLTMVVATQLINAGETGIIKMTKVGVPVNMGDYIGGSNGQIAENQAIEPVIVTHSATAFGCSGAYAMTRLDTDNDGESDWGLFLYMSQEQYDILKFAERAGERVKLTYYRCHCAGRHQLLRVDVGDIFIEKGQGI